MFTGKARQRGGAGRGKVAVAGRLNMLEEFGFAKFRFTIEALERMHLPAYKGSMLRGGFGYIFKKITCVDKNRSCDSCLLESKCPYAYIFETTPSENLSAFASNKNLPRPYIFEPPLDTRRDYYPGDKIEFNIVLIGKAIEYLTYLVFSLQELGAIGIGVNRAAYKLVCVEAVDLLQGGAEIIYDQKSGHLGEARYITGLGDCVKAAEEYPSDIAGVNFLTPLRIKHSGKIIFHDVPFEVLVQNLTVRLNTLNTLHCKGQWSGKLGELREAAKTVSIKRSNIDKHNVRRRSNRQGKKLSISGITGSIVYRGTMKLFLPILVLGQAVHIGSSCVFGCGWYELEKASTVARPK